MKISFIALTNFIFALSCYQTYHALKSNWTTKQKTQRPIIIRHYFQRFPNDRDSYDNADSTREAILTIIEQSWFKVCVLIPQAALNVCEDELRDATSLLVLASIRRSALTSAVSRKTIERMLEQADEDQDGQVTFVEWFDWLSHSAHAAARPRIKVGNINSKRNRNNKNNDRNKERLEGDIDFSDPMIESLGRVLSHAVCTVKVASRIQNDPYFLSAAFVAGGIQSGVLDKDVCRAMLSRLSTQTRDLVTQALSVESGSMAPRLSQVSQLSLASSVSQSSTPSISSPSFLPSPQSPLSTSDSIGAVVPYSLANNTTTSRASSSNVISNNASSSDISTTSTTPNNLFFDQLCVYDSTVNIRNSGSSIKRNSMWSASSFPTALTQAVMSMNNQDVKSMDAATVDIMTKSYNIDDTNSQKQRISMTSVMTDKSDIPTLPTFVTSRTGTTATKKRSKYKRKSSTSRNVVISTIDLSSVPVLTAPALNDINTVSAANSIRLARLALANLNKSGSSDSTNVSADNDKNSDVNNGDRIKTFSTSGTISVNVNIDISSNTTEVENTSNAFKRPAVIASITVQKDSTHEATMFNEYIDRSNQHIDNSSDENDEEEEDYEDEDDEDDVEEADKVELSVIYHVVDNNNNDFVSEVDTDKSILVSASTTTGNTDESLEKKVIVSSSLLLLSASEDSMASTLATTSNTNATSVEATPLGLAVTTIPSVVVVGTAEEMYAAASRTLEDMQQARISLTDFDDKNSAMVRKMIVAKVGERKDVMALSLALRAARLQHAGTLQNTAKHRVAVETLQIWAPLSFQLGMSSQVPELEVHSYVLLFPQSFNSFIGWFDHFRPLAKKVLRKFRGHLKQLLESDPVLPSLATKITLQSRIKAPSSAFKKMVRSSKGRQDLHDMLGLRVIITENLPPSITSSSLSSSSSLSLSSSLTKYEPPPRSKYPDIFPVKNFKNNDNEDHEISRRIGDSQSGEVAEGELLSKVWSTTDDLSVATSSTSSSSVSTTTSSSAKINTSQDKNDVNDDNDDDDEEEEEEDESEKDEIREDAVWRAHDIIHTCCCFPTVTSGSVTPSSTTSKITSGYFGRSNERGGGGATNNNNNRGGVIESEWCEDLKRFKDYVTHPKPSGYQSLHMVFIHQATGINLEIQIRSQRMHFIAEYGPASHKNYKALVLPTAVATTSTHMNSNTNNDSTGSSSLP